MSKVCVGIKGRFWCETREQPVENFSLNNQRKDGRLGHCKTCNQAYQKETRTKEGTRDHNLRKYGIDLAEYNRMLLSQGGKCAVCGSREEDQHHGVLSVDHDHDSGNVRGLLCTPCNQGIGHLRDSEELLRSAIDYIKQYEV